MSVDQIILTLVLGIASSLVAGGVLWFFRERVREILVTLDISAGAVFAWLMAFVLLTVIAVFGFMQREIPGSLTGLFAMLVGWLLATTVWRRS